MSVFSKEFFGFLHFLAYLASNFGKVLKHFIQRDEYDMVVMGKQSIDDDYNQTGQMLAGLLNWPQATFASKVNQNIPKSDLEVSDPSFFSIRSILAILSVRWRGRSMEGSRPWP